MSWRNDSKVRRTTLVGICLLLLVACGGSSPVDGTSPVAEVLGVAVCPEPKCVSIDDAAEALGFPPYQPEQIPADFSLYERALRKPDFRSPPPGLANSAGSSTEASSKVGTYLITTYRFRSSENVPGVMITQSQAAPPGVALRLSSASDDCGELVEDSNGWTFYANGLTRTDPGIEEGHVVVCVVDEVPARDAHTVLVTRENVLIQILAFPESGVSRDEVLDLANSLTQAK